MKMKIQDRGKYTIPEDPKYMPDQKQKGGMTEVIQHFQAVSKSLNHEGGWLNVVVVTWPLTL